MTETYLLTWNPKRWPWLELEDDIRAIEQHGFFDEGGWSCGNRRSLPKGSRVFLMKLGEFPKGIIASGSTISPPLPGQHWDSERAELGEEAFFVGVRFDRIERELVIMLEELQKPPFSGFSWTPQSSGIRIPDEIAAVLEVQWSHRNSVPHLFPAQEIEEGIDYPEGATRTIRVNSYERNGEARSACLAHYGAQCIVCGFIFANRYGDIAADFIEVHHLVPLSEIKNEYKVDPIRDLRPVCSNCHSVLLLRKPPYSIDELQKLIGLRASEEEHYG